MIQLNIRLMYIIDIMRILIVEDEHKIASSLKRGLESEGYAVDAVFDGDDGYSYATTEQYDLIILDQMLPGQYDGVAILEHLRKSGNHVPVLFLTAKATLGDKIDGLDSGADDYLTKPFSFTELLARVRALLRRPTTMIQNTIEYQDLSLSTSSFRVTRSGKDIELTAKEFTLLEYLMRHAEQIVSKDTLIQHVWNYDADVLPNTVEVYIGYLRNKIDKPFGKNSLIQTKRGFGYYIGTK